ncbi:MAG: choice-of-anchor D domain-containing protein [Myxococcales bacterium]
MSAFTQTIGTTKRVAAALLLSPAAAATSSLYTSQCASCHVATPNSCNACHAHGTHSSSSKSDINIKGTTNKTSYAPGETVTVTVTGGYQSGWVRVGLFDQNMSQLAVSGCTSGMGGCTNSSFPKTLTATAPSTPGTYVWAVGWYGNKYDASGASFGSGTSTTMKVGYYTPDPNNADHGYQIVGLTQFTVTAPATPTPAIAMSPASLAFSSVAVGASRSMTTQVQNTGGAALNVTGVTRCAGTPTSVTWSPTAAFTVAASSSTTLTVTFAPTAAGALPAGSCLTIASNDPGKPTTTLTLTGTGTTTSTPAPTIALNPSSLGFGSVTAGTSKTLSAQVQNTGTASLSVTGISLCAGTPAWVTWTPASAFTVAAGQSATVNVTYAPPGTGALAAGACLTIASNDPGTPTTTLGLTGTATSGAAPAIAISPTSLDFQTVTVGASQMVPVQVHNTGTSDLHVSGISPCPGTTGIRWAPNAPFTVPPAGLALLGVIYAPSAQGALPSDACLSFFSDDPAQPTVKLALAGTATVGDAPALTFDPPSVDFTQSTVKNRETLTTTLRNTGSAPLDVNSIRRCAGTPDEVTWSASLPVSLVPGGSTVLSVTYTPDATEDEALPSGSCLVIGTSDPTKPTVTLSLTGKSTASGASGSDKPPTWGCSTGGTGGGFLAVWALVLIGAAHRRKRAPQGQH